MAFQIIRDDITRVSADAIVNTANPEPVYGGRTDAAIYEAAGADELLAERKNIGVIPVGEAVETPAFSLDARYIIHTVGPVWRGGGFGEMEDVRRCYENSLALAERLGCESIAFPLIATGTYGFPKDEALKIAISAFSSFLMRSEMDITLVVFDKESFVLSGGIFAELDAYIDENYVGERLDEEYAIDRTASACAAPETMGRRRPERLPETVGRRRPERLPLFDALRRKDRAMRADEACGAPVFEDAEPAAKMRSLDDLDAQVADTWQEMLFRLIDEKGFKPVDVYKSANIDKKLFSKIKNTPEYQPKKETALAFCIGLHLNIDETKDFLARAGYALSPSSKFDLVLRFYIEKENYDIFEINEVLFDHGLNLIGKFD